MIKMITDAEVKAVLDWNKLIPVVKQSLMAISNTQPTDGSAKYKNLQAIQSPRTFTRLPDNSGILLCMPGFIGGLDVDGSGRETHSSLACKLISVFNGNATMSPPLPTLNGSILLFDDKTGTIEAMIDADAITQWRTAAVTCVATNLLWVGRVGEKRGEENPRKVLAIFGAGVQGRIHAIAMQKQFGFYEIRIWNRTSSRGQALVNELQEMNLGAKFIFCQSRETCARDADVILTTTPSLATIIEDGWVKLDAHINGVVHTLRNNFENKEGVTINVYMAYQGWTAIGVGAVQEIAEDVYKRGSVYVESVEIGGKELPTRKIIGALGQIALGTLDPPQHGKISIFQSLGVGVEDAAVARMVYNLIKEKNTPHI